MNDLPTQDLRSNRATWAVPLVGVPALTSVMLDSLPPEPYDPAFRGQALETTYFDTPDFRLRQARRRGDRYLTLRIRCYQAPGAAERYALSAKTEDQKVRMMIDPDRAEQLLQNGPITRRLAALLPADLLARLLGLIGDRPLVPIVTVCARRYAVEDEVDRLTLDLAVHTDSGKCLDAGVLEFKSTAPDALPPGPLAGLSLRPIKISKFLWSTTWR